MLIKNRILLDNLIKDLSEILADKKGMLTKLNKKITHDTNHWIEEDYKTLKSYLKNYSTNIDQSSVDRMKPKGKIFIILSYNEPFILSVIPILNALVAGNEVILKPSRGTENFSRTIWLKSGLARKFGLKLEIVSIKENKNIEDIIRTVRAVFFFGSYKVAKIISKICGDHYVEFYPEVEGADVKVFNKKSLSISEDTRLTISDSFTHSGQICQRIHGILIQERFYDDYVNALKKEFIKLCQLQTLSKFIDKNYASSRKDLINVLMADIDKATPSEVVIGIDLPILVIRPSLESGFMKNAYFLPVLWAIPFKSENELVRILNSRNFFLGINIQSDNQSFTKNIIDRTKYTRYTINRPHTDIRNQEGWGGSWPSGFSGYKKWLEHFTDPYIIFDKTVDTKRLRG